MANQIDERPHLEPLLNGANPQGHEAKINFNIQDYIKPHTYTLREKIESFSNCLMQGYFVSAALLGPLGIYNVTDFYNNPLYGFIWNYVDVSSAIGFFNQRNSWQRGYKTGLKPSFGDKLIAGLNIFAAGTLFTLNTLSVLHHWDIFSPAAFKHLGSVGFSLSMFASFVHAAKDTWVANRLLNDPKYMLEDILQKYQQLIVYLESNARSLSDTAKKQAEAELVKFWEQAQALALVKAQEIGLKNIGSLFQRYTHAEFDQQPATPQQTMLVASLLEQQREKRLAAGVNAAGYFGATVAFATMVGFTDIGMRGPELTVDHISGLEQMALFSLTFAGAIKLCQLIAFAYSLRDEHKDGRKAFLATCHIEDSEFEDTFFQDYPISDNEKKQYILAWQVNKHKFQTDKLNVSKTDFYQKIHESLNKKQLLNAAVDDFRLMQFLISKGVDRDEAPKALEDLLTSHGDSNARHFLLKASMAMKEETAERKISQVSTSRNF